MKLRGIEVWTTQKYYDRNKIKVLVCHRLYPFQIQMYSQSLVNFDLTWQKHMKYHQTTHSKTHIELEIISGSFKNWNQASARCKDMCPCYSRAIHHVWYWRLIMMINLEHYKKHCFMYELSNHLTNDHRSVDLIDHWYFIS